MYQIGGNSNASWQDEPHSLRMFWSHSYAGLHSAAYLAGYELGKADLEAESFDGFAEIEAVESSERGNDWSAKLDGYKEATASRGRTRLG